MEQKRSSTGIIVVIVLGLAAMGLAWFDSSVFGYTALRSISVLYRASSTVIRLVSMALMLPILLCAVFTALSNRTAAMAAAAVSCVLYAALAMASGFNRAISLNIIACVLTILVCVLTMLSAGRSGKQLGAVLAVVAVISLIASAVLSGYVVPVGRFGIKYYGYDAYMRTPQMLVDAYVHGLVRGRYFGQYFITFSRGLLYLACALAALLQSAPDANQAAGSAGAYQDYYYRGPSMPGLYAVSQGKAILLSIVTLGIHGLIWQYRLIRNTRVIAEEDTGCAGEFLLYLFVPFYSWYWAYTRQKKIASAAKRRGYVVQGHPALHLWLILMGVSIISECLLQETFNRLAWGYVPLYGQPAPASPAPTEPARVSLQKEPDADQTAYAQRPIMWQ